MFARFHRTAPFSPRSVLTRIMKKEREDVLPLFFIVVQLGDGDHLEGDVAAVVDDLECLTVADFQTVDSFKGSHP